LGHLERRYGQSLGRRHRRLECDDERVIYLVNRLLCHFDNGGYDGFLYNVSPSDRAPQWRELRDIAHAVAVLGSQRAADVLRETAELMEGTVPTSATPTWAQYLALADPSGKTHEFNRVLAEMRGEIWQRLEEFTTAHSRARP
jgi:hypothetical protein